MPVYESRRAVVCVIPALALTPPPSLAGILDDLEPQLGVDKMKSTVVNIMQQSANSFILHLAHNDQVADFMAMGLTFRKHLLEMSPAKNSTTVILERVPYGLPEAALTASLTKFGVVKTVKHVTHKGYGVLRCRAEIELKQDIPSRVTVQGNLINVFYRNQPRSCFVCRSVGHEARSCPTKAKKKTAAPPASDPGPRNSTTFAAVVEGNQAPSDPPLSNNADLAATSTIVHDIPPPTEDVSSHPTTDVVVVPVADPPADKQLMDTESDIPTTHQLLPLVISQQSSTDNSASLSVRVTATGSNPTPQEDATQPALNSVVPPTTQQLLDNLNTTPPAVLHTRPPMELSDSSQSALDERPTVKRSARQKKRAQPYNTPLVPTVGTASRPLLNLFQLLGKKLVPPMRIGSSL